MSRENNNFCFAYAYTHTKKTIFFGLDGFQREFYRQLKRTNQ